MIPLLPVKVPASSAQCGLILFIDYLPNNVKKKFLPRAFFLTSESRAFSEMYKMQASCQEEEKASCYNIVSSVLLSFSFLGRSTKNRSMLMP